MEDPRLVLRRHGLTPRKALGQNFLVSSTAPARIAELAALDSADTVLEVGAGVGTLTAALAARAGRVLAVETDDHLLPVLEQELAAFENVSLIHGDILELNPVDLLGVQAQPALPLWGQRLPNYAVVANLPYYITAAVMRHLLEADVRPARMVVTVQREVAKRIVAGPGEMSLLALGIQFYGQPRLALRLKRGAFFPPPKVESAVVCIDLYDTPPVAVDDVARFFRVARAGFAQKRKQLRNTLAASLHLVPQEVAAALTAADVDATRRAETLALPEWQRVVTALTPLLA